VDVGRLGQFNQEERPIQNRDAARIGHLELRGAMELPIQQKKKEPDGGGFEMATHRGRNTRRKTVDVLGSGELPYEALGGCKRESSHLNRLVYLDLWKGVGYRGF